MRINIIEESEQEQNSNAPLQRPIQRPLPLTRGILQTLWEGMQQMRGYERNIIIRRLTNTNNNEIPPNSNSEIEPNFRSNNFPFHQYIRNNQTYLSDYQLYPLNIDWKEIIINNRVFYKIYQQYGNFAAALITSLNQHEKIKFSNDLFFQFTILNYFFIVFKNDNYKELYEFIQCLPKLKGIKEILEKRYYHKNEITTIKIVLDIYESFLFDNHLRVNSNEINIGDLIDCLNIFYNSCTQNDIQYIKETFTKNKKILTLISKYHLINYFYIEELGFCLYNKKEEYLNNLIIKLIDYKHLYMGLTKQHFYM